MFNPRARVSDTDTIRLRVSSELEPDRKSALGQFMTPSAIAEFMASLFDDSVSPADVLDAGAGIGSLTLAAARRLQNIRSVEAWELDPLMRSHLGPNLDALGVAYEIHTDDFIISAVQRIALAKGTRYSHAILNPPYKKLNSQSTHRALLRKVGIETVNLYSAFVALSVLLMREQGQIIAIVPRSFCNGPYYKPFRRLILRTCALDHIHIFESRTRAFKDENVLQENVIIKLVRGKHQGPIIVSSSHDQQLADYRAESLPFCEIVQPNDPECFIRIPTGERDAEKHDSTLQYSLADIGLEVCTGPVVDFRLKNFWLNDLVPFSVPLLYPHHFSSGALLYPKEHKKPNALMNSVGVQRWLMPNECYVLVKRLSSKEERRRVVAYVYDPRQLRCAQVAFENHWNVFHENKHGIGTLLANGLACFLNSTALDKHFRIFSGHTQVNATDLRNIKYPSIAFLHLLGARYRSGMTQAEVDDLIKQTHE